MFSATFNLLPGSDSHPEFFTIYNPAGLDVDSDTQSTKWNSLGWYPVISTITGIARALLGIIHAIIHLAIALFSSLREHHLAEAKLGFSNAVRGMGESVPLLGNLVFFVKDMFRASSELSKAKDYMRKHPQERNNVALLVDGEVKASMTKEEFVARLLDNGYSVSKLPTAWEHFALLKA